MKYIASIVFFLLLSTLSKAQISIGHSNTNFNVKFNNVVRLENATGLANGTPQGIIKESLKEDVLVLDLDSVKISKSANFAGVFFDNIPNLKQGVTMWRYKPWNSWTKPIPLTVATKMEEWDVQFFYWQYNDGLYGAAVPLSGNGYRTTLGSNGSQWGSKAVSYVLNERVTNVPGLAIAFGKDPFELFERIYRVAMTEMGHSDNLAAKKKLPPALQYIGWCTWNSSDNGKNLNEQHVIEGVKTFTDKKFPLGWVLIDDGWFRHTDSQLQSILPDPAKFPNGFKPLINKLKNDYGVRYTGVWHAFNGYWNGIDPNSELGKQYKGELFLWNQRVHIESEDTSRKTYSFLKPLGNNYYNFYSTLHKYLKGQGFDFIKVDNQLSVERMAVNNYPINELSSKMHQALYKSANEYFEGAVINCMDMTAEAYTNFGTSAVARSVEDYFPYEKGETYNMQRGNAAAHVLQAIYNSVYFSQMVYPDFDMFQSHNPNAVFHALARTLNNGPIYLTDIPGKQNFDVLNRVVYSDGRSIRSATALLPTEDCLFQVQSPKVFKAYSKVGNAGLLVLYNAADADHVEGEFKAADVSGFRKGRFALFEYFSGKLQIADANQVFQVSIPRMGYKLQYVVPVEKGFAPFGLINKYNAPATILNQKWVGEKAEIMLYEGGEFKAYSIKVPRSILVNGKKHPFVYQKNLVIVNVPNSIKKPLLTFLW